MLEKKMSAEEIQATLDAEEQWLLQQVLAENKIEDLSMLKVYPEELQDLHISPETINFFLLFLDFKSYFSEENKNLLKTMEEKTVRLRSPHIHDDLEEKKLARNMRQLRVVAKLLHQAGHNPKEVLKIALVKQMLSFVEECSSPDKQNVSLKNRLTLMLPENERQQYIKHKDEVEAAVDIVKQRLMMRLRNTKSEEHPRIKKQRAEFIHTTLTKEREEILTEINNFLNSSSPDQLVSKLLGTS